MLYDIYIFVIRLLKVKHCSVCTMGSENTAALIFDCRWSYVVNCTPQMYTLGERVLYSEARRLTGH